MKHLESKKWVALIVWVGFEFTPISAGADVVACTQAHATGQREAKVGQLKKAAELFASCGAMEDCPQAIRDECVELFRDVERSIPTVIFKATDSSGKDVTDVRVFADEQLLTDGLGGRALVFDPGLHHLKFVFRNGEVVESDVLVREGEKNRLVTARAVLKKTATVADLTAAPNEHENDPISTLPTGFWVAAGVSVVALGSFGVFGLLGKSAQSTLKECSPDCAATRHRDYDVMRRDYLIADVSLVVSAISAGAATWLYLSTDRDSPRSYEKQKQTATTSWAVVPSFTTGTVGVVVTAKAF